MGYEPRLRESLETATRQDERGQNILFQFDDMKRDHPFDTWLQKVRTTWDGFYWSIHNYLNIISFILLHHNEASVFVNALYAEYQPRQIYAPHKRNFY